MRAVLNYPAEFIWQLTKLTDGCWCMSTLSRGPQGRPVQSLQLRAAKLVISHLLNKYIYIHLHDQIYINNKCCVGVRMREGTRERRPHIPALVAGLTHLTHQSASPSVFHPSVINLLLTPPSIATHLHSHSPWMLSFTHTRTHFRKACFFPPPKYTLHSGEMKEQFTVSRQGPRPCVLLLCLWLTLGTLEV